MHYLVPSVFLALILMTSATDNRQCIQGASDVASCISCTASWSLPYGVSVEFSCDDDCRSGTSDCQDCCWECEATANSGILTIAEVGGSNQDTDGTPPRAVQIQVSSKCHDGQGAEGTTKCVTIGLSYNGTAYWKCIRLTCDPCSTSGSI